MRLVVLVLLLFAGALTSQELGSTEQSLLSVLPTKQKHIDALIALEKNNDHVELLERPALRQTIHILSPPALKQNVMETLQASGLDVQDRTQELHAAIRRERSAEKGLVQARRGDCRTPRTFPNHTEYYKLEQIEEFMKTWADCYPHLAQKIALPSITFENRTVYYMTIGKSDFYGSHPWGKPVIMIEALAHPREWIATAAVLYAIDTMLEAYSWHPRIKKALDEFDFVIIPVVNPDGYVHTWEGNRFWRNNRRVISPTCTGVNINRNYDVKFRTTGITEECGSRNYPGETAFSEAETQNVRELFYELNLRMHAFLSVHAYSKLLLYPWGYIDSRYTHEVPSNVEDLKRVGRLMLKDLKGYKLGTAYEVLKYGASGASEDWALQENENIYAYCYELRPDMDSYFAFKLPQSQIIPTGIEFLRSVLTLSENI